MQSRSNSESIKTPHLVRATSLGRFQLSERDYPAHQQSPVHVHQKSYIIIPITAGYTSTFGRKTSHYHPWSISFHPAGVEHSSAYPAEGSRVLYAEVPACELKSIGDFLPGDLTSVVSPSPRVEQMARQLYREFDSPDEYSSLVLEAVLLQILACFGRERKRLPTRVPQWLSAADSIIEARFAEPLHLSDIAQEIGVHPGHLAREYRRHRQCTVGEQIRQVRVRFASQMLTGSNASVASIAHAAGYTDQSHLTSAFRNHLGTTPAAYRRAAKTC